MKFNFTYLFLLFGIFVSWSQTQISGTQNFSYCYGNYEDSQTIYQSANGNALSIQFTSGEIEEDYDSITIIDGNGSGTELLSNYSGTLQGLNFTALSGYITINIVSDISLSCQDDIFDQINYTITALSCAYPVFTTSINANCSNINVNDASVTFNISSMNGHSNFTITNGNQTHTIHAPGNYTFTGLTKNATSQFTFVVGTECSVNIPIQITCIAETAECSSAFPLLVGNTDSQYRVFGNNTNGFINYDDDTWDYIYCGGDYGVWFTLTVPQNVTSLTIEQFEHDGSLGYALEDGHLSVYRGNCNSLTEIACEDDTDGNYFPRLELQNLIPGEQLYIFATGYWYDSGVFELAAWNSTLSQTDFNLNKAIKLYPNPVNDVLSLATDLEVISIEVYNLLGQQVLNNKASKQINVSQLPIGTFVIKAQTTKGIYTSKFIKN